MDAKYATEWQELTTDAVVSIYNRRFDGFVRVHPDGYVELSSPAGMVTARFKELEQADWLRESYVRLLVAEGVVGEGLSEALAAIERVDRRMEASASGEPLAYLLEQSRRHFEAWCTRQGMTYDQLDDDQVTDLVNQAITSIPSFSGRDDDQGPMDKGSAT